MDVTFNLNNADKLIDQSSNPFKQGQEIISDLTLSSGRNSIIRRKGNKRAKWGLVADGGPMTLSDRYEEFKRKKDLDKKKNSEDLQMEIVEKKREEKIK